MGSTKKRLGKVRFYIDPETEEPHIYEHGVTEEEVEEVLREPGDDFPARNNSRIALGSTNSGRHLQVVYVPDSDAHDVFVVTAYDLRDKALTVLPPSEEAQMKANKFPSGWDEQRVRELIEHYDGQTNKEAAAEHEAALSSPAGTLMEIPTELVPLVRDLIARHDRKRETRKTTRVPSSSR